MFRKTRQINPKLIYLRVSACLSVCLKTWYHVDIMLDFYLDLHYFTLNFCIIFIFHRFYDYSFIWNDCMINDERLYKIIAHVVGAKHEFKIQPQPKINFLLGSSSNFSAFGKHRIFNKTKYNKFFDYSDYFLKIFSLSQLILITFSNSVHDLRFIF